MSITGKKENSRIASHESIPFNLNGTKNIREPKHFVSSTNIIFALNCSVFSCLLETKF